MRAFQNPSFVKNILGASKTIIQKQIRFVVCNQVLLNGFFIHRVQGLFH
jgi:hypothetical protein